MVEITQKEFEVFKKLCVATCRYYWKYTPTPFLQKQTKSGASTFLGDSLIKKHIKGEEVLGLSPFVDNEKVLYGGIDFDVHGPSSAAEKLQLEEFDGDKEKLQVWKDEQVAQSRKEVAEDIPKITQALDKLGYSYFLNSSGSEGKHIRVYGPKPTNAKIMRYMLLDLLGRCLGCARHEVFPKQDYLDESTPYGNQMKGVLAIHPKTGNISGIISNDKILNRKESLKFLVDFEKKLKTAKEIEFEIPPELEKKHKKVKFTGDITQLGQNKVPNYCAGFEEVACCQPLPSGEANRHEYLDGNAYQYLQDKPELLKSYCEMQGRNMTAFNNAENWIFSCQVIHKYLRKNSGKGILKWQEHCQKCPLFKKSYLPEFEPLIDNKDNKEKRDRIINDILKSKSNASPLQISTLSDEIEIITGIEKNIIKDTWKSLKKEKEKKLSISGLKITSFQNNVETFYTTKPFFYDKSGLYWFWDKEEKKYVIYDEVDVMRAIDEALGFGGETVTSNLKNNYLEAFRRVGRKHIPQKPLYSWIQFKNKIVDFETGEEFEASPDYFFTNPIPWDIGRNSETPKMDDIIVSWVGIDYLQQMYQIIAFSLIPDYPLQRLFCFIGSGSNGKSCFLELVTKFIGIKNVCASELDVILKSKFETTRLYKKLICLMGETNFGEMSRTSMLKKLTGKDLIGYEFKNKGLFEDYNYAKIFIATNNLPTTADKTDGFYRRWMIIDFPNKFTEKKDILNEIPESEYENLACKCIPLLKELLTKREFDNEGTLEERKKIYEDKSNPFDKFYDENVVESYDDHISKRDFKKKIDDWCSENNFRQMAERTICKFMNEKGIETSRVTASWETNDGKKPRYMAWIGIKWK